MPSLSERRHHLLEQVLQWREMRKTPAYNITMSLRVAGALDIGAIEKSFAELIRRHVCVLASSLRGVAQGEHCRGARSTAPVERQFETL